MTEEAGTGAKKHVAKRREPRLCLQRQDRARRTRLSFQEVLNSVKLGRENKPEEGGLSRDIWTPGPNITEICGPSLKY